MDIEKEISFLNDKQKEAVLERKSKRLLVLAGAGSGKTKMLTVRIAYLISLGVKPENIFAVTFTNKAAAEMKERIVKITKNTDISKLSCGTFHSSCLKIIKDNLKLTNIISNFNIIDSDDQKSLIKRVINDMLENKDPNLTIEIEDIKEVVKTVQYFINLCKENEFRPNKCDPILESLSLPLEYKYIYKRYEDYRTINNSIDFTDIILYAVEILRDNQNIQDYYKNKFRHIFVDEFQDTNHIQYRLINLITGEKSYHTMVGDDDQLIYSWRGANIHNLKNYTEKNKSLIKIVKLEQNYRSDKNILACANHIIANNKDRLGKKLWSDKVDGDLITVIEGNNQEEEASLIANKIIKLVKKENYSFNDITVLYRANSLSRAIESHLTKKKIAYKVIGGLSFWQRKEIKDVVSYLILINNTDNDLAFERVVNFPKRGIGNKTLELIRKNGYEKKISLLNSTEELLENNNIKGKSKEQLNDFIKIIKKGNGYTYNVNKLINYIIFETKIEDEYLKEGMDVYTQRKENLSELINYSSYYEPQNNKNDVLADFLHTAQLQSDADKNHDINTVKLMTIHASKGLEFPIVFLCGLEDGIFPSSQSITLIEKKPELMEEERRLMYVAMTRAEKKLFLGFSNRRYQNTMIYSRFLDELPIELLKHEAANEFSLSRIGQKIRNSKKNNNFNQDYKIGDNFEDDIFGSGEIIDLTENEAQYILKVDFDFLGVHVKYINK